jgi:hypothetical protein
MVNEPDTTTYSDATIQSYIETHPLLDERGQEPYTFDTSTEPPTQDTNEDWIATYDLHAAAADIWEEKAAGVADEFDFHADGGVYQQSQKFEMYMKQARRHRAQRGIRTITLIPWAKSVDDDPDDELSN